MRRRSFLQQAGLSLAGLGFSEIGLAWATRHQQVLAAATDRKLALLVGINQYRNLPLSGCVTDTELQRELLIARFGFQPADILTLTDAEATQAAIVTAFQSHLIGQARSGDVVVFHFSGYGENVNLDNMRQLALATADEPEVGETWVVNALLVESLNLLVRSLPTEKVSTILDTSYTYLGRPLQGNFRIRARPNLLPVQASEATLALQAELADRDPSRGSDRDSKQQGMILTAAPSPQAAMEANWAGFSAGLFTYALTQQLWQATPTTKIRVILAQTRAQIEPLANQVPHLSSDQPHPVLPFFVAAKPDRGVAGVVTRVEEDGKTAWIWLAGLPIALVEQYSANSLLTLIDQSGATATLQVQARDGLTVKAKVLLGDLAHPAIAGGFVREAVRVLPRSLNLTVALDSSLERIERVDAISAFSAIPRVSVVIAGEQAADYLFSKLSTVAPTQVAALPNALPGIGISAIQSSYGLFSAGQEVLPNTIGAAGEAVKVAVRRLVPKLPGLLAAKWLSLVENEAASQLPIQATLKLSNAGMQVLQQRSTAPLPDATPDLAGLVQLPVGSQIQYQIKNHSPQPVYLTILSLDSRGNLTALPPAIMGTPAAPIAPDAAIAPMEAPGTIAPQQTITIPANTTPTNTAQWTLHNALGFAETFVICSLAPFTQLQAILAKAIGESVVPRPLSNPLEVVQALLQDLQQASQPEASLPAIAADAIGLDVKTWAGFRFVYQVV